MSDIGKAIGFIDAEPDERRRIRFDLVHKPSIYTFDNPAI